MNEPWKTLAFIIAAFVVFVLAARSWLKSKVREVRRIAALEARGAAAIHAAFVAALPGRHTAVQVDDRVVLPPLSLRWPRIAGTSFGERVDLWWAARLQEVGWVAFAGDRLLATLVGMHLNRFALALFGAILTTATFYLGVYAREYLVSGLLVVAATCLPGAWGSQRLRDALSQKLRNRVAEYTARLCKERNGRTRSLASALSSFALFLHPFGRCDSYDRQDPRPDQRSIPPHFGVPTDNLNVVRRERVESFLANALWPWRIAVSISATDQFGGAGTLRRSDDEWQGTFELLARYADEILVLPFFTAGCTAELEHLRRNGLLEKCVFVQVAHSPAVDLETEWTAIRDHLRSLGIESPMFSSKGQLYRVDNDGQLRRSVELPQTTSLDFLKAYKDLITIRIEPDGESDDDP